MLRSREIEAQCFPAYLVTACSVATATGDHAKAMELCQRLQRLFDAGYRATFELKSQRDARLGGRRW